MKNIYFTVGPSQLYPTTTKHFLKAVTTEVGSMNHRGPLFAQLFKDLETNLKKLLAVPADYKIFFLGSGTEGMERIIENTVEKTSFHFVNGAFSKKFYTIAQELKKQPLKHEVPMGEGFDITKVDIPETAEVICFTQSETSIGTLVPEEDIETIKKVHPDKLIAVDTVSSMPYVNFNYSLVDMVFFSVQKGFGLPPGLGVIIVSPKALEKAAMLQEKGLNIGTYHNFPSLLKWAEKGQTPTTPPVMEIYVLNEVIKDMLKKNIVNIRKETKIKAKLLYDFFDNHKHWKPFVKNPKFRSQTVAVIQMGKDTKPVDEYLRKHNIIVGRGYGDLKEEQFRIANFPALTITQTKRLITLLKRYK